MQRRFTLLPVVMVVVIVFVALFMIFSEPTDAPNVVADRNYPHHVCTFNSYCAGASCSREPLSFVAYLSHKDGRPRLDMLGVNPAATLTQSPQELVFETMGGTVSGTLKIFSDRGFDFTGTANGETGVIEHFGTGECERRVTP